MFENMKVEEIIYLVKTTKDENLKKQIIDYLRKRYKEKFYNTCKKYNKYLQQMIYQIKELNSCNDEKANEILDELINNRFEECLINYIENDYAGTFAHYLRHCAIGHITKRKLLIDLMFDENSDLYEKQKLVNHYSKNLYNRLIKYEGLITKEEINDFCNKYVSNLLKRITCEKDFYYKVLNDIIRFEKRITDEENFIRRYADLMGLNDKIVNYFCNKYEYLIEEELFRPNYQYIKNNYKSIVSQILKDTDHRSIFVYNFKKKIKSISNSDELKKGIVLTKYNLSDEEKENNKIKYSYIKRAMLKRFNEYFNKEELEKIINEKYDYFFEKYFIDNSSEKISDYISKRLNEFLKDKKEMYLKISKRRESNSQLKELFDEYYYVYYKLLDKANAFIPKKEIEKKLLEAYNNYIYNKINLQSTKRQYNITNSLRYYIKKLEKEYDINYVNDLKNKFKSLNLFNSDINDEVIDTFVNCYLNSNIKDDKSLEEHLIKSHKYFDLDKYEEAKDIAYKYKYRNVLNKKCISQVKVDNYLI